MVLRKWRKTPEWPPARLIFVICCASMRTLPGWMRWMAVAGHFNPCGVKSWKNMSPKMRPVKWPSASGDPLQGSNINATQNQNFYLLLVAPHRLLRVYLFPVFVSITGGPAVISIQRQDAAFYGVCRYGHIVLPRLSHLSDQEWSSMDSASEHDFRFIVRCQRWNSPVLRPLSRRQFFGCGCRCSWRGLWCLCISSVEDGIKRQNIEFGSRNAEVGRRERDRFLNSEVGMRKSEKPQYPKPYRPYTFAPVTRVDTSKFINYFVHRAPKALSSLCSNFPFPPSAFPLPTSKSLAPFNCLAKLNFVDKP